MSIERKRIHLVADFLAHADGAEYAIGLAHLLETRAELHCWSDIPQTSQPFAGIRPLRPFSGEFPKHGTLVIIGADRQIQPWIEHSRAARIIIVCVAEQPGPLYRTIAYLRRARLAEPELVFPLRNLLDRLKLPGRIQCLPLPTGKAVARSKNRTPVIGRCSRDDLLAHHPGDPNIYLQLAMSGFNIRILGGESLKQSFRKVTEGIALLPESAQTHADFLSRIDIFFYRSQERDARQNQRHLVEALTAGCAIVTSHTNSANFIEHGSNGFFVNSDEEAFNRIFELASDPGLLADFQEAAKRTAADLYAPSNLDALARWYIG